MAMCDLATETEEEKAVANDQEATRCRRCARYVFRRHLASVWGLTPGTNFVDGPTVNNEKERRHKSWCQSLRYSANNSWSLSGS
jgi:hypothetical protein